MPGQKLKKIFYPTPNYKRASSIYISRGKNLKRRTQRSKATAGKKVDDVFRKNRSRMDNQESPSGFFIVIQ